MSKCLWRNGFTLLSVLALIACADGNDGTLGEPDLGGEVEVPQDAGGQDEPDASETPDTAPNRADGTTPGPSADGLTTEDPGPQMCGVFGDSCTSNSDCCSEYCVETFEQEFICTDTCVDECPEGFECKVVLNSYPDVVTICVPNISRLCAECKNDLQCNGGKCIDMGGADHCTVDCTKDACPAGYECVDAANGAKQCIPSNGTCDCGVANDGSVRSCAVENAIGACQGVQVCDAEAGWSDCNANEPTDEICDGLDNDCDGLADEGYDEAKPCESSNEYGTCEGIASCQGPAGWVCSAKQPKLEVCDFLDNDCDGQADEDFKNDIDKYDDIEHCGGCGTSCTDLFKNAVSKCDATLPLPQCVVDTCAAGFYKANDYQCLPELDTVCQPCTEDFQCGGGVCAAIGGTGFCISSCEAGEECGIGFACLAASAVNGEPKGLSCMPLSGACDCIPKHDGAKKPCTQQNALGTCFGFQTCDGVVGWAGCDAAEPEEEDCDGVDNDCNGLVDDGLPLEIPCENDWPGVGTCEGTATCQAALGWVCSAQVPGVEICDFADNNCDGAVDEDFKNADGKYATLEHCGKCNDSCSIANATATCDASGATPLCVVVECDEGYYKANNYVCLEEGNSQCKLCSSDAQCDGQECVQVGDGTFCAQPCTGEAECDEGTQCVTTWDPDEGAEASFCVPMNGTCDCTAGSDGAKKPCEVTNEMGVCVGFQTCEVAKGWVGCTAQAATDETCDGLDNDCDGFIDDGLPATKPCETTNEFGTCTGSASCFGAAEWVCAANKPVAEACDFVDNDCDGQVDEDYKDAEGKYSTAQHCGTCNSTCGGTIANALSEKCDGTKAKPQCVVDECKVGFFKLNPFQCVEKPDVTCVSCTEDVDCFGGACVELPDGKACLDECTGDEPCKAGFLCDGSYCQPQSGSCGCTEATKGVKTFCAVDNDFGTCVGFSTCDPAKGWSPCDAKTPTGEICDGLDNDCNGIPDDGLPVSQPCENKNDQGTCTGNAVCQGSLGWICQAPVPSAEICDFQDNDCNGEVDETFTNSEGKYASEDHCGTCNKACGTVIANSAAETCDTSKLVPQCVATACLPGYFKQNELQCVPNPAVGCTPCVADDTCYGGKCTAIGASKFCLEVCEDGACKSGFTCGADLLCHPENDTCDCTEATAGATRTCQVSNPLGKCLGFETCDPAVGWTNCTAVEPIKESCDGKDNDCNGLLDDGLPPTQQCFNKNTFGVCKGQATCYGAAGWVCLAPEPAAEACDFKDNDCDGATDEDYKDGSGKYTTAGHCGSCNNPCGDVIPNSAIELCDASKLIPQCIVEECEEGYVKLNDFQCLEVPPVQCEPCSSDANCFGSKCTNVDTGMFCLVECDEAGGCGDGYTCVAGTCWPENGTCDCTTETEGAKRTCFDTNELGVCYGFETCDPAIGWGPCDAPPPADEVCDGKDNDCDGFIDDDLPATKPCNKTNGFGSCPGQSVCFGTVGWFCQAQVPSAELCDAKDNDCDGFVDEDFKNDAEQYAGDEHCGSCNTNCSGAILNGKATCDTTKPVPQCVVEDCGLGWEKFNEFLCVPITATLCEPCAVDDNCITTGAKCVPLADGPKCGIACDEDSDCPAAYKCIDPGVGAMQCVPATGSCDCDGSNLDLQKACKQVYTPPGGGPTSTCFGTNFCTATGWSGCELPLEQCNGLDDNCDGEVDELFKNDAGAYATDQHCGKCNLNCEQINYINAVGKCDTSGESPDCSMTCKDGFFDTNQNPGDGCECEFESNTDYPADGVDTNCDGIDGELNNAIFVAKTGSDDNPGTKELPKLTIQAAIDQAEIDGKRDIYVNTSVYSENIRLVAGVSVYGGYSADFAQRDTILYETAIIGVSPTVPKPGAVNAFDIKGAGEPSIFDGFTVFGFDNKAPGGSSYTVYIRSSDKRLEITNNRFIAGNGGGGAPGTHGSDGGDGSGGSSGADAKDVGSCTLGALVVAGGGGGTKTCGGTSTHGGAGGDGYCPNYDTGAQDISEAGKAGQNGGGSGGGHGYDGIIAPSGGTGGGDIYGCAGYCGSKSNKGCYCDSLCQFYGDCCADACALCGQGCGASGEPTGGGGCSTGNGCGSCIIPPDNLPMVGTDGTDGGAGSMGAGGSACTQATGTLSDGLWVAHTGVPGKAGGSGGGGGGGGAGNGVQTCACSSYGGNDTGGTGGGGGAGGCAATGGSAGTGGGGSFGVFIYYDAPPASAPIIDENDVQRAVGGLGGPGGNGGVGGLGGLGAKGGASGTGATTTFCAGKGGNGGKGGDGGHGGGGGGGCGGASYAVFATGQGTVDMSSIKSGIHLLPGGSGGAGGSGGLSLENGGGKGHDGAFDVTNF